MPNNAIRLILILGCLAIGGIIFFQSFWVIKSWDAKEEEFNQRVMIALRQVAEKIAAYNQNELPKNNLIQRRSSNYYSVNINSAIDANILEDFLIREFNERSIHTSFEYAVYDCSNDHLVYGNFCNLNEGTEKYKRSDNLPKFDDLIYYFVVNFPNKESYLINDLRTTILISLLTLLTVVCFMYAIWIIVRQKKVTDLQTDFINNMTHEFKTPISSIKIASDVFLGNPLIQQDSRLNKYAGIIKDQNERLNAQVEKVLNIAKLEKDQFKLKLEIIDLIPFIEKIIEQEKIKFDIPGGEVILISDIKELMIKADALHLNNVLSNILDNALKYSNGFPEVSVLITTQRKNVIIEVKDQGVGIDEDQIKKLFNKFYRISTGDVHNVKGFGLGLYYVKNICEAHNWKIEIKSVLGVGTSVYLEIPIHKQNG